MQFTNVSDVMFFDCTPFSPYTEEKQILFFGGKTTLKVMGIEHLQQRNFDKFIKPAQEFLDMIDGQPATSQHLKLDMSATARLILQRHSGKPRVGGYMIDLVMYNLQRAVQVRLLYSDLMTRYDSLECIFKVADSPIDVLDIANIAVLFRHSKIITFVLTKSDIIGDKQWQSMMKQLADIYNMGLVPTICFEFPPKMSWHQYALFDAAFSDLPPQCNAKMQRNVISFDFISSADDDATDGADAVHTALIEKRAHEMSEKLLYSTPGGQSLTIDLADINSRNAFRNALHTPLMTNALSFDQSE